MKKPNDNGITLVELLVVLVIIGILTTVAVNVYIGHVGRARIAAARITIAEIETAIAAYLVDTGQLPPSGSGLKLAPDSPDNRGYIGQNGVVGNGYLFTTLTRSLNGNMLSPVDSRWRGPYVTFQPARIGDANGFPSLTGLALPQIQILDPWGSPYIYVRASDYTVPVGETYNFDPAQRLTDDILFGTETFYNASSFQIVSKGPDGVTADPPYVGVDRSDDNGDTRGRDDVTNFRY